MRTLPLLLYSFKATIYPSYIFTGYVVKCCTRDAFMDLKYFTMDYFILFKNIVKNIGSPN